MRRWSSWVLNSQKAFARRTRGWWAGVTQTLLSALLILIGVIWLVATITLVVLYSTPTSSYMTIPFLVLHLLLSVTLIGLGFYLASISLRTVSGTVEQREALINPDVQVAADPPESNSPGSPTVRRRRRLPTVPTDTHPPRRGTTLEYRLCGSRKNLWALGGAGGVFILFVALAAVLVITAWYKYRMGRADYFAGGLAIPFLIAAVWAFANFVRQLLKLSSIGPTILEISDYPLIPGREYEVLLSQSGRLRIQLLDVLLECEEVATFDQGTNIRTERSVVYRHRLFRKRGINVRHGEPFVARFPLHIPAGAMHSFQSQSNRVLWKIEVYGQAKGFPRVGRTFEIIVLPIAPGHDSDGERHRAAPQPATP